MGKEYTHTEVVKQLRDRAVNSNTQLLVAQQLGISPQYLSLILNNKRMISQRVARRLGYIRVVRYRKENK